MTVDRNWIFLSHATFKHASTIKKKTPSNIYPFKSIASRRVDGIHMKGQGFFREPEQLPEPGWRVLGLCNHQG